MPIIGLEQLEKEPFHDGAFYQTMVGDDQRTSQIRLGIQTSPPGFSTGNHSHPYWEYVTILEGEGMAWKIEKIKIKKKICAGDTMSFPPNVLHRFRAIGNIALKTYGIHVLPNRIILKY